MSKRESSSSFFTTEVIIAIVVAILLGVVGIAAYVYYKRTQQPHSSQWIITKDQSGKQVYYHELSGVTTTNREDTRYNPSVAV